ncbi:type II toxin-antitoxin system HipA family toxin [Vibrio sp. D431a]|nr:type II toxin-antitoxin system HipA family toxin [Vibrio sp. D431a]MDK9790645.1 type II toxin-antitoxin system HipA family toxin [Vibrio sp. D431a]
MNGLYVGEFNKAKNGAHSFIYAKEWLESDFARPISLSLQLRKTRHSSDAVINFFDNLLPDVTEVRNRIVARYKADSSQAFDLLEHIGRDSIGALTLLPVKGEPNFKQLEGRELDVDGLRDVLTAHMSKVPLGMREDYDDFRISVAGAQEKTALLKLDGKWHIPVGNTPTTHILKLPIGNIVQPNFTLDMSDSVENEHFCMRLASKLGFNVPDTEIVVADGVKALAVERFDRTWSRDKSWILRIPVEDFCQVKGLPSGMKYEADGGLGVQDVMDVLTGSSNALRDRVAFFSFLIFQWLIGATDGHAKNFSLFIDRNNSYSLTPFYDVMSAFPVVGKKGLHPKQLKLAMSLKGSKGKKYQISKIFKRHFIDTAELVGIDKRLVDEMVVQFQAELPKALAAVTEDVRKDYPDFPERIIQSIANGANDNLKRLGL